jgi:Spy/CpxP family protein refolding chaperone
MNWKQVKAISAAGALTMAMLATCAAQSAPPPAQTPSQPPSATTPPPTAGKMHGKGMHGMENLNLTDEQKSQIHSIRAKEWQQVKAVKSDTTLTDAQRKEKIMGIRKDSRKQVSGVLTPEQRQQWHENMMQHHQQAKQKAQQPS